MGWPLRLPWPDGALALVLATRVLPLLAAPVTLYLVATRRSPAEQGFYFILVNVQALAPLMELGAGTILVQFASHESQRLGWSGGALVGDTGAVDRMLSVIREGWRWYGGAAAVLLLALPAGLAAFGAQANRNDIGFAGAWSIVVVATALYLPLVPLLCTIEGVRGLVHVQRMRLVQTVVALGALWLGLLTRGALTGVAAMAAAWLAVAAGWLVLTHAGLAAQARDVPRSADGRHEQVLGAVQWRTALSWLVLWLAPQALAPLVLAATGAVDAGRVGMSLAIATAPATLGSAWLQSRYPLFAATLAAEGRRGLDTLAGRAARQALLVCLIGGVGLTSAVALLHRVQPALAARLLPTWAVAILCATSFAWVAIQALTGYLRADREEPLFAATAAGVAVTVGVAAVAAPYGAATTCVAYAAAVILIAVPFALAGFRRARARHLSPHTGSSS